MADHSKPTVTSLYTDFVSEIAARFNDLAVGLDPAVTTATNIPTNAIRWSGAANKWQKWNGTAWVDLTAKYAIDVESVDGKSFGTFNQGGILYASSTTAAAAISAGTAGHLLASDGTGAPYWVDPNGLGVDTANMAAVANEILVSASTPSDTTMSLLLVAGQSTDYQDVYLDSGLNWDATNKRLGVGTSSPGAAAHIAQGSSPGLGFILSGGSTASQINMGLGLLTSGRPFIGTNTNTNPLEIGTRDAVATIFVTNSIERSRIDASGNWMLGKSSLSLSNVGWALYPNGQGDASFTMAGTNEIFIWNNTSTAGTAIIQFRANNVAKGQISWNNTSTTFSTSSDYRLKNIEGEIDDVMSGAFIDALLPKFGTWKADGSPFAGFLAHEFQLVSPSSVTGQKDATDKSGRPVYQSMQASSAEVMANVIAQLKSLRKRVAILEGA